MQSPAIVDTPVLDTGSSPAEYQSRIEQALELMRTDAILHELDDGTPQTAQRRRLIEWHRKRRSYLATRLGI